MNPTVHDLQVTTAELVYLLGLFGVEGFIGVSDPFSGWPIEEVEVELHRARAVLAERGLLSLEEDGQVSVNSEVETVVTGLAESTGVVVIARTGADGQTTTVSFHVHPDATVEVRPEGKAGWYVTPIRELTAAAWRGLGIIGGEVPSVPGGKLPHSLLAQARDGAVHRGLDDGIRILRQALPDETAVALAETLANPAGNAAITVIDRTSGGWKTDGLAFLEGLTGLWLLRTQGESVQVAPCSVESAKGEVVRLVGRVSGR